MLSNVPRGAPAGAGPGRVAGLTVEDGWAGADGTGDTRSGGVPSEVGPIGAANADNDARVIMTSTITSMH